MAQPQSISLFSKLFTAALLALTIQPAQLALAQSQTSQPQPTQAIDCEGNLTQQQMNFCAAQEYWERDRELNRMYRPFKRSLAPAMQELLTDSSLAWIAFRDADCKARASRYEGGSIQPLIHAGCMTELTENRIDELPNRVKGFGLTYVDADRQLNRSYQTLMSDQRPREKELLIDAQLAWIDYRDRHCAFETAYAGTEAIANNPCLVRLTDTRTQQLKAQSDYPG